MRWGVEKRLEFIEFRLFWEGGINRADIIEQFGVSVPQASKDLALYEEKAPGNLDYDKSAKRYRASSTFKPVFFEPDTSTYLAHLRSLMRSNDGPEEGWLDTPPEFDAMPIPHRSIEVAVLREILSAIREGRSLEIRYQSMNPNKHGPEWRRITPHAFGHDGLRWHVRAFCHIDQKFKDFILSRCLKTRHLADAGASPADDLLWNERFSVELAPNPKLSESQQAVIAQDFAMHGGRVHVPIRKALLYYFQKRLRLDVADALNKPQEVPVVIANRAEFDSTLTEAMS